MYYIKKYNYNLYLKNKLKLYLFTTKIFIYKNHNFLKKLILVVGNFYLSIKIHF